MERFPLRKCVSSRLLELAALIDGSSSSQTHCLDRLTCCSLVCHSSGVVTGLDLDYSVVKWERGTRATPESETRRCDINKGGNNSPSLQRSGGCVDHLDYTRLSGYNSQVSGCSCKAVHYRVSKITGWGSAKGARHQALPTTVFHSSLSMSMLQSINSIATQTTGVLTRGPTEEP